MHMLWYSHHMSEVDEFVARLKGDLQAAEGDETRLSMELDSARQRADDLREILSRLERQQYLAEAVLGGDSARVLQPSPPPIDRAESRPQGRVQSTKMVADLINELGRPVHRDEIVRLFDQKFGIPETWTIPRNVLGTALNRAAQRGLIEQLNQFEFAPLGHPDATRVGQRDWTRR